MFLTQDADDLLEHVKTLATSEGRAIGTAGHARARKYLSAMLHHYGLEFYSGPSFELTLKTKTETLTNIVAVAPGRNRHLPPVLLAAHYDTFQSFPGADDNAAGVAVLLEIGRELVKEPADCDIVLAFFDNEEHGFLDRESMGSIRFYENQMLRPVSCALVLDLVGHDVPIDKLEAIMFVTGMESSLSWMSILKDSEPTQGLSWATVLDSYVGSLSDHYVFASKGDPFLFFSSGRWEHYHQPTDTFDKLNYSKMAVFKKALLAIARASAARQPVRGKHDSTEDEIFFLNKNLLPNLPIDLELSSRMDINKLVSAMLSRFKL